jgi:hypothetical protein
MADKSRGFVPEFSCEENTRRYFYVLHDLTDLEDTVKSISSLKKSWQKPILNQVMMTFKKDISRSWDLNLSELENSFLPSLSGDWEVEDIIYQSQEARKELEDKLLDEFAKCVKK